MRFDLVWVYGSLQGQKLVRILKIAELSQIQKLVYGAPKWCQDVPVSYY